MSQRCAFEGNCPMGADIIELSGPCEDNRGEKCGRVAAYAMLNGDFEGLEDLDDESPIVGTFKIDTVPAGMPSLEVRQEWVGVELPVRQPERLEDGEVEVSPADAVLSLLSTGRLDATAWFFNAGLILAPFGPRWVFQEGEGTVTQSEPVSSRDFYGAKLDEQVRSTLEEN